MHHTCKNCHHSLNSASKYCSNCGQSTHTERLRISHILHDFIHAFFHADKGFFLLIKKLALNPGDAALRYVQGERTRFFNPFNFLLINGAIFLFLGHHFNNLDPLSNDPFAEFLENYSNLILIFSLPLLAGLSWLLFKSSGKNYSEILVLCCYLLGEMNLFYNIIVTPFILLFRNHYQVFILIYGILWLMYFIYGAVVFFNTKNLNGILRATFVILLFQFFTGFIGKAVYFLFLQKP
jgi:hypothetical protein